MDRSGQGADRERGGRMAPAGSGGGCWCQRRTLIGRTQAFGPTPDKLNRPHSGVSKRYDCVFWPGSDTGEGGRARDAGPGGGGGLAQLGQREHEALVVQLEELACEAGAGLC